MLCKKFVPCGGAFLAFTWVVKITLRRRGNGYFLGENGNWVASGLQARGFSSQREALEYCESLTESDVYVFILKDNPAHNVAAPENCAPVRRSIG